MPNISIIPLAGVPIETITSSWNTAFSDYQVKVSFTPDMLGNFFRQNGVRFDLSLGAFDCKRLVGLWMNGVRTVNGELTAYDSGTAIFPDYRSQGISKMLAQSSTELLRAHGVTSYVLEVLQDNKRAFGVYQKDGFIISRNLICYNTKTPLKGTEPDLGNIDIREMPLDEDIAKKLPHTEFRPSWQNSIDAMLAIRDSIVVVTIWKAGAVICYGIIQPARGRISQIGATKETWNSDIPNILLHALAKKVSADGELAMINVDESAPYTHALLKKHGFAESVRQYEMKKTL